MKKPIMERRWLPPFAKDAENNQNLGGDMPETKQVDPKIAFYDAQTAATNCFNAIYNQALVLQAENAELRARIVELETRKE